MGWIKERFCDSIIIYLFIICSSSSSSSSKKSIFYQYTDNITYVEKNPFNGL